MDQPIVTPTTGVTPIVCDMTDATDTPEERLVEYGRLFAQHLIGRERTAEGIRFRLRPDDGVEASVRDLSVREQACCPFMDFTIAIEGGEVQWDIAVVDDDLARAILNEFYDLPDLVTGGAPALDDRMTGLGLQINAKPAGTETEVRPGG